MPNADPDAASRANASPADRAPRLPEAVRAATARGPSSGLVLFGGTFDPPHLGHTALAAAARDARAPGAWLVFVPAARSPHKPAEPSASDADRVEMLERAVEGLPRACVWTDEIDRAAAGSPSFWVTTLERARRALGPETPMRFILGADQAAAFRRWREPDRILELAEPVVLLREPIGTADALERALRDAGEADRDRIDAWRARCVETPRSPASSTAVREALARGDTRRAREMLAPGVAAYIAERGLYRAG